MTKKQDKPEVPDAPAAAPTSDAGQAPTPPVTEATTEGDRGPLTVAEVVDAGPDEAQGIVGSDGGIYKAGAGVKLAAGDGFHVVDGGIAWPNEADARRAAVLAGAEGALAAAAASAVPGNAPTADPAVVDAFKSTPEQMAATVAQIHAEGRAAEFRLVPLTSLEAARALPEVAEYDLEEDAQGYEGTDEREISAFKDTDGRTMMVVLVDHEQRLVKVAKPLD